MKTYKELRDGLFEEVEKIDISKLGLGFTGLSSYAELLERMSKLPERSQSEIFENNLVNYGFSYETPRKKEKE